MAIDKLLSQGLGKLTAHDPGGGATKLLGIDTADGTTDDCCCTTCACCKCEKPSGTFCCIGIDDTLIFTSAGDAITFDIRVCLPGEEKDQTICNAFSQSATYDFVVCDDSSATWLRPTGAASCLPLWVIQPCDPSDPWILLRDDGTDWQPQDCFDCTTTFDVPPFCLSSNIAVCDLTPECCGGPNKGDPPDLSFCCFDVDPNTCDRIRVDWWCFHCIWLGEPPPLWEEKCQHFWWEADPVYITCTYNAGTGNCDCL